MVRLGQTMTKMLQKIDPERKDMGNSVPEAIFSNIMPRMDFFIPISKDFIFYLGYKVLSTQISYS